MGDLLIRGLDPETRNKLQASAHKSGRSLSDEAAARLKKSLAHDLRASKPVGQRLRDIVDGFSLTEHERSDIAASRREGDRQPPTFDVDR